MSSYSSLTRRLFAFGILFAGAYAFVLSARAQTNPNSSFGTSGTGTSSFGTGGRTGTTSFGTTGTSGTGSFGTTGTTGTTGSTGGLNLQQLLNQAGLGGGTTSGLGNSLGSLGTGSTGAGTTGNNGLAGLGGLGGGSTGAGGTNGNSGRSPITNSLYSSRGAAIAARRPGLQIQQAIAVEQGNSQTFTNTTPIVDKGFFRLAFEQLVLTILDSINQGFGQFGTLGGSGLNSLGGLGSLGNIFQNPNQTPNQQTQISPLQNAITTGQGTSSSVP